MLFIRNQFILCFPLSPVHIFLGKRTGSGHFKAAMFIYQDELYLKVHDSPPKFDMDDRLRVKVQLIKGPADANLQLVQCWGSPGDISMEQKFVLIDD